MAQKLYNDDPQSAQELGGQYTVLDLDGNVVQTGPLGYPAFYVSTSPDSEKEYTIPPTKTKYEIQDMRKALECSIKELGEFGAGFGSIWDDPNGINIGSLFGWDFGDDTISGDPNTAGIGGIDFFDTDGDDEDGGGPLHPDTFGPHLPVCPIPWEPDTNTEWTVDPNSSIWESRLQTVKDLEQEIGEVEDALEDCADELRRLACYRGVWDSSTRYGRNNIISISRRYFVAVRDNVGQHPFQTEGGVIDDQTQQRVYYWKRLGFHTGELLGTQGAELVATCAINLDLLLTESEDLVDIVQILIRCRDGLQNRIRALDTSISERARDYAKLTAEIVEQSIKAVNMGIEYWSIDAKPQGEPIPDKGEGREIDDVIGHWQGRAPDVSVTTTEDNTVVGNARRRSDEF